MYISSVDYKTMDVIILIWQLFTVTIGFFFFFRVKQLWLMSVTKLSAFLFLIFITAAWIIDFIGKYLETDNLEDWETSLKLTIPFLLILFLFTFNINRRRWVAKNQQKALNDTLKTLIVSNTAQTEFMGWVVHELRMPMTSIKGFADLIKAFSPDSELKNYAQNITKSSDHMLNMINNLLLLSQSKSSGLVISKSEVNLYITCEELISICIQLVPGDKSVKVGSSVNFNPELIFWTDELRIRQIVLNLVTNAIKFTDEGKVTISFDLKRKLTNEIIECYEDNLLENEINLLKKASEKTLFNSIGTFTISVSDTGYGIQPDYRTRIFQPFFRGKFSEDGQEDNNLDFDKRPEGVGLGLAIVKSIVDKFYGRILLDSAINEGSTFTVHIPIVYKEIEKE